MSIHSVLESIKGRISESTGAIIVIASEINANSAELRLHFPSIMGLGDLLRALRILKELVRIYGFDVTYPQIECVGDSLLLIVKIVGRRRESTIYT